MLEKLLQFQNITVQCHDFPDADAIASGFVLTSFLKSRGKNARFIYSGRAQITKSNLRLMIEKLDIDITYVPQKDRNDSSADDTKGNMGDILVTVDCQYGSGNVTKFDADEVMIIDHHQVENLAPKYNFIESDLGSCSTLIWKMIKEADAGFIDDRMGTALYYGLYTDTNQFTEIKNPMDMDMRDEILHSDSIIRLFRNSNISIKELDIAGMAILRYSVNDDYRFAVIKSNPCDPNILGLIADFLQQVDIIDTCVVFAENETGIKISVRSCVPGISASELAEYLCKEVGSGGGHLEKAGGYISHNLFEEKYPMVHADAYFNNRMIEYHHSFDTMISGKEEIDVSEMSLYRKKKVKLGYVISTDICPEGTPIAIRTLEGDTNVIANDNTVLMIGVKGEVYSMSLDKFQGSNIMIDEPYEYEQYVIESQYIPTAKNVITGETIQLNTYAKLCETTGENKIYARQIDKPMKVFTQWYKDGYMYGDTGDYLAIRADDLSDCYIVDDKVFMMTYVKCE